MREHEPASNGRNFCGTAVKASPILLITGCAIWLLTLVAFWPVCHFQFLYFDDDINIFMNPHLGGVNRHTVEWMLTDIHYMRRYIPAGWAGLAILYGCSGLNPYGYHLACILGQGINAVLVFAICREIIKYSQPERAFGPWAMASAAAAAIWWALHPLRVETVAWASGYLYIQSAFFILVSFYLYIRRKGGDSFGRSKLLISAFFFILSIASYPMMLGYPVVLLCWEAVQPRRQTHVFSNEWRRQCRLRMLTVIRWFGVPAAAIGGVTIYAAYHASAFWGHPSSLESIGLMDRLERAVYGWGYYLWKPWWPFRAKLVPNSIHDPAWHESNFSLCLLVLAGMIYFFFVKARSRYSGFWAIGVAYLALLVPTLGLSEKTHFVCDRYSYLSSFPLAVALAVALTACVRPWLRWTAGLGSLLFLGGLFILTREQLSAWRNSDIFFNIALSEFSSTDDEKSRIYLMLANKFRMDGNYDRANTVCAQGLREFPKYTLLNEQKLKIEQTAEAGKIEARRLGLATPVCQLARSHASIAAKKIQQKEWQEAADHFRAALQAAPGYYPVRFELAEVLTMQGMPNEALSCYLQALAASNGHIANAERARFLFMLARASALNGEERLARLAFGKGQDLRAKIFR